MNAEHLTFGTAEEYYPLDEAIFLSSGIAAFESQLDRISSEESDVEFLSSLPRMEVYYGAQTPEIYPFLVIPSEAIQSLPTARNVLHLLKASSFESEHIENLDEASLPFPGYHPNTKNDEIHSDGNEQNLFAKDPPDEDELENLKYDESALSAGNESRNYHQRLRDYVLDQHLYYVLVHTVPQKHGDYEFSDYVILFAVGVSPGTGNLVGVVSYQVCHNLCD